MGRPLANVMQKHLALSPSIQREEARIVMDIRRKRYTSSSRSPSPPAPAIMLRRLLADQPSTTTIAEPPRLIVTPIFCRRNDSSSSVVASINERHKTTNAIAGNASPQPPPKISDRMRYGGNSPLNTRVSGTRNNEGNPQSVDTPVACGSDSLIEEQVKCEVKKDRRKQERQHGQQTSPEKKLKRGASGRSKEESGFCNDLTCPLLTATATVTAFASEEYLEKRRRRAARTEATVRQLGDELDRAEKLIEDKMAKIVRNLLRRVATEKTQLVAATAIVTSSSTDTRPPDVNPDRETLERRETWGTIAEDRPPSTLQGEPPWRIRGSRNVLMKDGTFAEEVTHTTKKKMAVEVAICEGEDLFRAHARASVGLILRRACLNLVNRPWRLAGVRLSIDPPYAGGRRGRATKEKVDKKKSIAKLVRDVSDAMRSNATPRTDNPFCEKVHIVPVAGRNTVGRSNERKHRRLVRSHKFLINGRRDLGKPLPPPKPQQRHPPPDRKREYSREGVDSESCSQSVDHQYPDYDGDSGGRCDVRCVEDSTLGSLDSRSKGGREDCRNFTWTHPERDGSRLEGGFKTPDEDFEHFREGDGANRRAREKQGHQEAKRGRKIAISKLPISIPSCRLEPQQELATSRTDDLSRAQGDKQLSEQLSKRVHQRGNGGEALRLKYLSRGRWIKGERAIGGGLVNASYSPQSSGTPIPTYAKLGKRPRWDARFGVPTRIAENAAERQMKCSRRPSPRRALYPQCAVVESHTEMPTVSPGVIKLGEVSCESSHDNFARCKLVRLKQTHALCEIGRERYSVGTQIDEMEVVVSELSTVFVDGTPSSGHARPERRRAVPLAEDSSAKPSRSFDVGEVGIQGEASIGNNKLDAVDEGPEVWEEKEEVVALPASHGLLVEFVWPLLRLWEGGARVPERAELSLMRSHGRRRQKGKTSAPTASFGLVDRPDCRSSGAPSDSKVNRHANNAQSALLKLRSGLRLEATSQGHHKDEHAVDRSRVHFLVLTLGFLRRMSEIQPAMRAEQSASTSDHDGGSTHPDNSHDEHVRDSTMGQLQRLSPEVDNVFLDLSNTLMGIRMLSTDQGMHGRIADAMPPKMSQALVHIIAGNFRPPPEIFLWGIQYYGKGDGDTVSHSQLEFRSFLGLTVRDLLCSRMSGKGRDVRRVNAYKNSINTSGNMGKNNLLLTTATAQCSPGSHGLGEAFGGPRFLTDDKELAQKDAVLIVPQEGRSNAEGSVMGQNEDAKGDSYPVFYYGGYSFNKFTSEDSSLSTQTGSHASEKNVCRLAKDAGQLGAVNIRSGNSTGEDNLGFKVELDYPSLDKRLIVVDPSSRSDYYRLPCPGDVDASLLAEMQRTNDHLEFPGLARDARIFADELLHLAEGTVENSHISYSTSHDYFRS